MRRVGILIGNVEREKELGLRKGFDGWRGGSYVVVLVVRKRVEERGRGAFVSSELGLGDL